MPHLLQVLKGVKVQAEKLAELLVPGFLLLFLFLWNSEKSGFKEPHLTTQMIWAAELSPFLFATQVKQLSLVKQCMILKYAYPILTSLLIIH